MSRQEVTMRLTLGVDYDLPPIALIEDRTTWFPAGAVRLGLEVRVLDETTVRAAFSDEQRARSAIEDVHDGAFADDGGLSIHVCATASGRELLRFDCFAATPHYHYISVDGGNRAIAFDPDANGEMVPWVMACLRSRLPQMLARAGAVELASRIDAAALETAVAALVADVQRRQGDQGGDQGEERHGQAG
jgi:hypothetical protein